MGGKVKDRVIKSKQKRGDTMDYLNHNIALNLKRLRTARGYTLDLVAEQTGVSKSMLGQIERGEANPSVSTLGKIVSGLRVELTDLVETPVDAVYPIHREELVPTKCVAGRYKVYTYFPYEKKRNFEIYMIEIEPGETYISGSHGENTREYVIVQEGELALATGENIVKVKCGDAVRFDTDSQHSYINHTGELLRFVSVFYYPD